MKSEIDIMVWFFEGVRNFYFWPRSISKLLGHFLKTRKPFKISSPSSLFKINVIFRVRLIYNIKSLFLISAVILMVSWGRFFKIKGNFFMIRILTFCQDFSSGSVPLFWVPLTLAKPLFLNFRSHFLLFSLAHYQRSKR